MKSELTDLDVHVHHRTAKAVLVSIDGNRQAAIWLPLSAIELEMKRGSAVLAGITLAEELAIAKGLV